MKTFLVTIIGCAAVMRGVCNADPSTLASKTSPPESSKVAAGNRSNAEHAALARMPEPNTRPASSLQNPPTETAANHNPPGNIIIPHPPAGLNNVASAGPSKVSINRAPPTSSTGVVRLGGSSLINARNRNPALTAIGGAATVKYGTTAAINGTGIYHKH
jgi:hypothetical protein